jgi:hypothetical protein
MRTALTCGVLAAAGVMLSGLLAAAPASADDGPVLARHYTGERSGAVMKADVRFQGVSTVEWSNIVVNDICPADGFTPYGYISVRFTDNTVWNGRKRYDRGGCESPVTRIDLELHLFMQPILRAGVVVCVAPGRCTSSARNNPHL